jgi:hypothetical protein
MLFSKVFCHVYELFECLSNLLETDLKDELLPLLEYHFLGEREIDMEIKIPEITELLKRLFEERGVVTKKLVLKMIIASGKSSQYREAVGYLTSHKNEAIRELALQIAGS